MKRYAAVVAMSPDLAQVLLIRKLRPDWQAGKCNVPGGKVEAIDFVDDTAEHVDAAFVACASRELSEETGLVVRDEELLPVCFLRYPAREGDGSVAECRFYAYVGDLSSARTKEEELVFLGDVDRLVADGVAFCVGYRNSVGAPTLVTSDRQTPETPFFGDDLCVEAMPNLPWIVAMARQRLRGLDVAAFPLRVEEALP